jgi:hypothetical protein
VRHLQAEGLVLYANVDRLCEWRLLESLNLSHCSGIPPDHLVKLLDCPRLGMLSIRGLSPASLSHAFFMRLATDAASLPLVALELGSHAIDLTYYFPGNLLAQCTNLRCLVCSDFAPQFHVRNVLALLPNLDIAVGMCLQFTAFDAAETLRQTLSLHPNVKCFWGKIKDEVVVHCAVVDATTDAYAKFTHEAPLLFAPSFQLFLQTILHVSFPYDPEGLTSRDATGQRFKSALKRTDDGTWRRLNLSIVIRITAELWTCCSAANDIMRCTDTNLKVL